MELLKPFSALTFFIVFHKGLTLAFTKKTPESSQKAGRLNSQEVF